MITRRSLLSAATALSAGASSLFNSSKVVKADNHLSRNINPTENSTVEPWVAVCMQVYTHIVNRTNNREDAMKIVHKSLDRWEELARAAVRGTQKHLLLFPEFALRLPL